MVKVLSLRPIPFKSRINIFLTLLPGTGVQVTLQPLPGVSRSNRSPQVPPCPIYLVLLACINWYGSLHYSLCPHPKAMQARHNLHPVISTVLLSTVATTTSAKTEVSCALI